MGILIWILVAVLGFGVFMAWAFAGAFSTG